MYAGRPSRRRITPEWAEKATEFVERAFRRAPPGRDVPCPCARCRCRNRLPRSKFDMQIHLGREGFMPDYTVWVHHGESRTATAKPSDDLPRDNDNLDGKEDAEVAAGAGDAVSKPQVRTALNVFQFHKFRLKTGRLRYRYIFRLLT
jgi:hypothetical protein